MKSKAYIILSMLMSALMLTSCIDVEEELSEGESFMGTVHYTGNAPKGAPLYTVAVRFIRFMPVQRVFETGVPGDVSVPSGHYKSYGFSSGSNDFTSAHRSVVNLGTPFSELYISQGTHGGTYNAYNSYSNYVNPLKNTLYICSSPVYDIYPDTETSVPLSFKAVSLQLDVNFSIRKEQGAEPYVIDKVETELSGIPSRIDICSGNIDCTETHKVTYTTTVPDNTYNTERLRCKGSMKVLSVIPPESSTATTGPGILQVHIHVTTQGGKRKVLHGQINLNSTIRNARITSYSKDGTSLTNNVRTATLNISDECVIDGNAVKAKTGGGDKWRTAEPGS